MDIQKTWKLCFELKKCLPNAEIYSRKNVAMKRIVKQAEEKEFTDIVVVHEDHKTPSYCQQCLFTLLILLIDALVLCHLPDGPTAYFKINSLVYTKKIKGAGQSTDHFPEIILNNFRTRLGHTISRMFECLFPRKPDFIGRRVITIHNQRYIIIRKFIYHKIVKLIKFANFNATLFTSLFLEITYSFAITGI